MEIFDWEKVSDYKSQHLLGFFFLSSSYIFPVLALSSDGLKGREETEEEEKDERMKRIES